MARRKTVADVMWDMLAAAGVRRCYGIVGDALNPVIDALRRNGRVDFVHVRHEEAGVFAIVLEGMPEPVGRTVTEAVGVPTIGIGAGRFCDGQVLVFHDLVGLGPGPAPRFARRCGL